MPRIIEVGKGKLEAARPIKDRGVSYSKAAEDLGIHPTQLRNWVRQQLEITKLKAIRSPTQAAGGFDQPKSIPDPPWVPDYDDYAEKVRTQFLSLRQCLLHYAATGTNADGCSFNQRTKVATELERPTAPSVVNLVNPEF